MSGVILRCPNCGTSQAAGGQCDACHEAEVRYFCLNHNPGRWLETSSCSECGARFGDAVPSRRETSRPISPPVARTPSERPTPPAEREADMGMGPWGGPPPSDAGSGRRGLGTDPFRILIGAMAAAARARSEGRGPRSYEEAPRMRRGGGGCIGRIFMLILFLIALFLMAPLFLGALFGFR